jgi:DNA-binding beta-propeller fold protein YncE
MTKKVFYLTILLIVAQLVNAQPNKEPGRASIHPSIVTLNRGEQQKFKVIKMATPLRPATLAKNVKWYVNEVKGGNKKIGTIDANGLYTAPDKLPSPREIHIVGKVEGVYNTQLFATVLIETEQPIYEMVHEFTEPVKTAKYFDNPHCVTLDKAGNLIIADYNGSRVLRFTPEGKYLGDLGSGEGNEPGQIYKPRVVKCDDKGDIYVSDQKPFGDRIQVFSHEGILLRSFGEKGSGEGEILRGHGIDFDRDGLLYTIDVDAMRVNIYTKGGEFVKSWGKDGPYREDFNASHGLIVDPNDDVFISGYYGALQKFDKDGRFLKTAFESDPPDGSVYIHSIADDKWGNVYAMVRGSRGYGGEVEVTEGKVVSMEKYNNNGDYVGALSLAVKAHAENWVYVDEKGYLYFIFRSKEKMGFEIFKPL